LFGLNLLTLVTQRFLDSSPQKDEVSVLLLADAVGSCWFLYHW